MGGWAAAGEIAQGVASSLLNGWMQYKGLQENKEQFNKMFERNEYWQGKQYGLESKTANAQIGLAKEKLSFEKKEAEKKWAWESDDRNWQRGWDVTNNFKSLLLTQPTYKTMLQNIWRRQ